MRMLRLTIFFFLLFLLRPIPSHSVLHQANTTTLLCFHCSETTEYCDYFNSVVYAPTCNSVLSNYGDGWFIKTGAYFRDSPNYDVAGSCCNIPNGSCMQAKPVGLPYPYGSSVNSFLALDILFSWTDNIVWDLKIETVTSVSQRFYLQALDNTRKDITGFVAAYIQKDDGSWMFLKNLPYLFSPGEEGIDFKCNSYKFEYVLDETPCGPQTYTLIMNKEKLYNARLDQPTFYVPVNFNPVIPTVNWYYSINGALPSYDYLNIYRVRDGYGWFTSVHGEVFAQEQLDISESYIAWGWDVNGVWWPDPVPVTLTFIRSDTPPLTWLEYYLHDNWTDYLGGWGPGEPYIDRMLLDTYYGSTINGFVGYGSDYDWTFEPLTVNALDEIVCSPTVTQSFYYNKASCTYTEVAPVLESDGTHSFYPGEMCPDTGVEVWYQTCSGAVKYLYLPGVYKTDCSALGHYSKGVYSKASGGKQKMMGHQFRGGYEKRISAP